ncbi:hypothetical protein FOXYSP1_16878 [Fusarium oxysporum f. sp. phaseoli]
MSLSKPQKEGLTATLSKPEDFLNWEHEFLLQAHRLGLQQHLKSKTFLGDEPAIPDIRKRRYTKTATAQRTSGLILLNLKTAPQTTFRKRQMEHGLSLT